MKVKNEILGEVYVDLCCDVSYIDSGEEHALRKKIEINAIKQAESAEDVIDETIRCIVDALTTNYKVRHHLPILYAASEEDVLPKNGVVEKQTPNSELPSVICEASELVGIQCPLCGSYSVWSHFVEIEHCVEKAADVYQCLLCKFAWKSGDAISKEVHDIREAVEELRSRCGGGEKE